MPRRPSILRDTEAAILAAHVISIAEGVDAGVICRWQVLRFVLPRSLDPLEGEDEEIEAKAAV